MSECTAGEVPEVLSPVGNEVDGPGLAEDAEEYPGSRRRNSNDVEGDKAGDWDWDTDPANPYNWSLGKKIWQIVMISSMAFTACVNCSTPSYSTVQDPSANVVS